MSERVDRFCAEFRDRLDGIVGRVRYLNGKVEGGREAARAAINREIAEARALVRRNRDDGDAARRRLREYARAAEASDGAAGNRWQDLQVEQLVRRAEDAEARAAWSIMTVSAALDEAELAALQAILAGMAVENVPDLMRRTDSGTCRTRIDDSPMP